MLSELQAVKSASELAVLLNVQYSPHFVYNIFHLEEEKKYNSFYINKKNGEAREIREPRAGLKFIQRRLADYLSKLYTPKASVQGYIKNKSVVTNAEMHLGCRTLLNIDLEEFFNSITFPRVRGLFMAAPYSISPQMATILANICVDQGCLPMGAPTSPVISNMICAKMDRQIQSLCASHQITYSRYSDDMSFSTRRNRFPITIFAHSHERHEGAIGESLLDVINNNGFSVNAEKTRISYSGRKMAVTGVIINRKLNVQRKHIKNVRAMLHNWEVHGVDYAFSKFNEVDWRNRRTDPNDFVRVLKGKIDWIGYVRGRHDELFRRLARRFESLTGIELSFRKNFKEKSESSVFVFESERIDGSDIDQGTAFYLGENIWVTCKHCILDSSKIFHTKNSQLQYNVEIIKCDDDLDIALFRVVDELKPRSEPLRLATREVSRDDRVFLLGFPNWSEDQDILIEETHIVRSTTRSSIRQHQVAAAVGHGNSGGPILNNSGNVVGVAMRGDGENLILPLTTLREFLNS